MIVKVQEGKEKDAFDKVVSHPIQSWEWGEFRKKTGNKIVRLGLYDRKKLLEGYQLTIHRIPKINFNLGVFLKGPAPNTNMISALKELGKKENLLFIRMEPDVQNHPKAIEFLRKNNAKPGRPFFTKSTFIIDLAKKEEDLLRDMHPKTRYNIKVAQKNGVEVKEDNSTEAFEAYLNLMKETTKRQGFYAHTEKYHKHMWETLHPAGIAKLLVARYKGEIISAWVLFKFKDSLYYPYGASSEKYKNVMANYAMMWEAIKFGKKLKLKNFDLWGREEGKGFTRFKEGFSPKVVEFVGTWDLVLNPSLYTLYRIAENSRWKVLKAIARLPLPKPSFR